MLITEWMSKIITTIDRNASLYDAIKLFQTRLISLLPVLEDGKLVGIISEGDIKKASPSDATTLEKFEMGSLLDSVKIASVMSKPVITIRPDYTVAEAASIMLNKSISGMPVLDNSQKIVGIITKSDIFRCYVSFTGISESGQIFAFKMLDKPGVIQKLIDLIRKSDGRLSSVMTSFDSLDPHFRNVFIHTFNLTPESFDSLSTKFYLTGELYFAADLSRSLRKIY